MFHALELTDTDIEFLLNLIDDYLLQMPKDSLGYRQAIAIKKVLWEKL